MDTLRSLKNAVVERITGRPASSEGTASLGQFVKEKAEKVLGQNQSAPQVAPAGNQAAPARNAQEVIHAEKQRHQLPPGSYDVANVSQKDLDKLRASKDPRDHRLAATIERSQKAYGEMMANGSQIIANRSDDNGGSPVVTILPPGFDRSKDARVHTHYHGWHSTVADPKGHGAGLTQRLEEIQKRDAASGKQTVIVLPEAHNAPDKGGAVHTDWSNVKSQAGTTQDALDAAGVTKVNYQVVSAHSAGGQAIANAINNDKSGNGLKADRLELQDSLYGSQGAVAAWGKTANGKAARQVVYYHGTNPGGRDDAFKGAFPGRYHYVRVPAPKPGDIPTVQNPQGKDVPAWNADAHNRAKGEFMDTWPDA